MPVQDQLNHAFNDFTALGYVIIIIAFVVVVVLLLRELWCWYYKINARYNAQTKILNELSEINTTLSKIKNLMLK